MPIDLSKYTGRYVALTLSSGHVGYGKVKKKGEEFFLGSAELYRGEVLGMNLIAYITNLKDLMKKSKRVQNKLDQRVKTYLSDYEIAPEHVTSILDIEVFFKKP